MKTLCQGKAKDVYYIEDGHRAHIDEEVLRFETNLFKVFINGLGRLDLKPIVYNVTIVIHVKSGNLHHLFKKHARVGGHLDLEEGQHHD